MMVGFTIVIKKTQLGLRPKKKKKKLRFTENFESQKILLARKE